MSHTRPHPSTALRLLPLMLLLTGCGPALSISSPTPRETVKADADGSVPVEYQLSSEYRLAAPGECGEDPKCGHLFVEVIAVPDEEGAMSESAFCRVSTSAFNADGLTDSPLRVDLTQCPRQTGQFEVVLGMHADDHLPLAVQSPAVRFTVTE